MKISDLMGPHLSKKLVGVGAALAAILSWFGRESIKHWFFDKVIHIVNDQVMSFLAPIVEFGPPIAFAAVTLWLFWRILKQGQTTTAQSASAPTDKETQRRLNLLRSLRVLYVSTHDDLSAELLSGLEDVPVDWINTKLRERGEKWQWKPAPRLPQPNMRLEDVVKRITGKAVLPGSNDAGSAEVRHACETLREKALLGLINVFGGIEWRTTKPADFDRMVRDSIPTEYWKAHRIDVIGFLGDNDKRGMTTDLSGHQAPEDYYGVWFDKNQIDALWH